MQTWEAERMRSFMRGALNRKSLRRGVMRLAADYREEDETDQGSDSPSM